MIEVIVTEARAVDGGGVGSSQQRGTRLCRLVCRRRRKNKELTTVESQFC